MKTIGVVAIVLGVLALGYGGFRYVWPEEVASVGPVHMTVERHEDVVLAPLLGSASIVAGLAVLLFAFKIGPR